jgi:hypothetical protein
VHTALGFDAEDTTERTAFTGSGAPKVTDNLALSAAQPTTNPMASRPLGLPAPATAPAVTVNLAAADPDEGKYSINILAKDMAFQTAGWEYRITVAGGTPQPFTLVNGSGGKVTPESFAAQVDALTGVRAIAPDKDDEDAPLGVKIISEKAGESFTLERMLSTKVDYAEGVATLSTILSASGTASVGATLLRATATSSAAYAVVVTDAMLKTLSAGDTLGCTVSGTQRFAVTLSGNSRASVVASLIAAGVQAQAQDYVPGGVLEYSESSSGTYGGQPGGVRIIVGSTVTGAVVELQRGAPTGAAIVITQAWLSSNVAVGDKWQVQINSAAPVAIALQAGAGTYPAAVTVTSLKQALASVQNLTVVEEMVAGVPQLRLTSSGTGSGATLTIKKIVQPIPRSGATW